MSRRMLSSIGLEGKQTLADDLESLLYVVLYCALLWLPHELSQDDVQTTMEQVFEFARWHPGKKALVGGDGKVGLALSRRHIRHANFSASRSSVG